MDKQEPVAVWELEEDGWNTIADPDWMETLPIGTKLYTAPPKKEWVGLDGEIPGLGLVTEEFYNGMLFAEDILREKNGG